MILQLIENFAVFLTVIFFLSLYPILYFTQDQEDKKESKKYYRDDNGRFISKKDYLKIKNKKAKKRQVPVKNNGVVVYYIELENKKEDVKYV